jgi:hypothetical protein
VGFERVGIHPLDVGAGVSWDKVERHSTWGSHCCSRPPVPTSPSSPPSRPSRRFHTHVPALFGRDPRLGRERRRERHRDQPEETKGVAFDINFVRLTRNNRASSEWGAHVRRLIGSNRCRRRYHARVPAVLTVPEP